MLIIGGASQDVNQLQSNAGAFRNEDFIVNANSAFMDGVKIPALASNYTYVGIWNAAGSGKTVLVDRITVSVDATSEVELAYVTTALATDHEAGVNKQIGQAAATAHIRYENNVGILGDTMGRMYLLANTWVDWVLEAPIQLGEDTGIMVFPASLNKGCAANYEWREI